ncbi:MAG: type IV secretory system conjugative DNA transfer family protein [Thermoproteota archaeon]|nr:type IV secretory system conjugative DNA transfer family protein [Thermoproteota archaeon]
MKNILYNISVFRDTIAELINPAKQLHDAHFAGNGKLKGLFGNVLDNETGLLLGRDRFGHVLSVRPTKSRRELGNILIEAPTRGGKGLLATSQLLTWPHSVIVNDIKGDLFSQTAGYRNGFSDVIVVDPTGVGNGYDPLEGKNSEDELFSSAAQLLFKADEGDGAIFTQRATVMLTQLFLAAREEGEAPFPYVRHMVRSGLTNAVDRLEAVSPELATQFLDVEFSQANLSDRFLLSAWGTLSARIRPLLTETVIRSLASSHFSAGQLMRGEKPVTVYLRWPERDLLALSPLVRLIWGSLIDELITTYDRAGGQNCHPVLLLIDEAGRSAIPSLADHATTVVGRGISLWIAVQSLSQLEAVYGRTRARTLRDNMESQVYYRPSDQETADYLERCLGRRSGFASSQTTGEGSYSSQSLSEQAVPLMTAQAIKQMGDEEIIGFHRRLPPFEAKRMDWRDFPELQRRRGIPPPKLQPLPELEPIGWRKHTNTTYFDPDLVH